MADGRPSYKMNMTS